MNIINNIYLDYQATTPVDKRVIDKMIPYFGEIYGNPHSRNHSFGWEAEQAVEVARENVAKIIGANPKEIIFTSGATESNNLAIKGLADFYGDKKNHIITCVTEHKCVLESCRLLSEKGFEVTYLQVNKDGLIDIKDLESKITDKTLLVSIMGVHNEIGVIQPLKEIGEICRKNSVFFHTDCAQAIGKIKLDVNEMNIDLLSISGHKIYAPKGVGALYVRRKPRVRITAMMSGGGQERGMRSGTLSPALCVGLGEACRICADEIDEESKRITKLKNIFLEGIHGECADIFINGSETNRVPGNINLSFAYVEGESLMMGIKNLAVSSGSACTSASLEPSYVLKALGVSEELAHTSLRIGIGRYTSEKDIRNAVKVIVNEVKRLRNLSPLWEMAQEGVDISKIKWASH
ncbi:MAG: IscS subfamily cysteine desulfurase [Alphaproteobacteria bacterium]|tara:strand:- start:14317 stop:15534 length:1218 start_codon:yes stop_codon:yes gene_type:complete